MSNHDSYSDFVLVPNVLIPASREIARSKTKHATRWLIPEVCLENVFLRRQKRREHFSGLICRTNFHHSGTCGLLKQSVVPISQMRVSLDGTRLRRRTHVP